MKHLLGFIILGFFGGCSLQVSDLHLGPLEMSELPETNGVDLNFGKQGYVTLSPGPVNPLVVPLRQDLTTQDFFLAAVSDSTVRLFRVSHSGETLTSLSGSFSAGNYPSLAAMAFQMNGGLLGFTYDGTFMRFNALAKLDPSFGSDGYVQSGVSASAFTSFPDGRILAAGWAGSPQNPGAPVLVHMNADGTVPQGGIVNLSESNTAAPTALALAEDGEYYVGGAGTASATLTHYSPDDHLDTAFAGTGVLSLPSLADAAHIQKIQIGADGSLFLSMVSTNIDSTPEDSYEVKHFSNAGIMLSSMDVSGKDCRGNFTALPGGKVLVVGDYYVQHSQQFSSGFCAVRFRPDGSLDPTFGKGGKITNVIFTVDEKSSSPWINVPAVLPQEDGGALATISLAVPENDSITIHLVKISP